MSMHDDDRRPRRSSPHSRWDEDDRLARNRDSGDLRRRGHVERGSSRSSGAETAGQGAGMGRPSGGRGWDEDYGDRRSRGRYDADRYHGDDEDGARDDPRNKGARSDEGDSTAFDRSAQRRGGGGNRAWFGTRDYERYAAGGRYSGGGPAEGAYGAGRSGGAYGDDAMPSGGSTTRGRRHRGEWMSGASERAMSGGLGGTTADDGVSAVAGRIVGPGRLGRGMSGKGPKGYARSDERIREDVCDRLTDDPQLDASSIDVRVQKGEVTLDGTVGHRNDKRHAEDLIDDVSGVKHVQNNLRVKPDAERGPRERATNTDIGPTS